MKTCSLEKLLFSVILFISSSSMAQTGYTINLITSGFKDSTKFYLINLDLGSTVDSAYLKNGRLIFKGYVQDPVAYWIRATDGKYLVLYADNKAITITADYHNFHYAKIEGSELNSYWIKSRDWQKKYSLERDSLYRIILSMGDSPQKKEIIARTRVIDKEVLQYRLNFIKNEKPTYFTLHELYFIRNDLHRDTLKSLFNKFPKTLRDLKDGEVIQAYITHPAPEVGTQFIDIEGMNIQGLKYKLSDLAGKYVLLDFWASWCAPCRQENPLMLNVYQLYRSKGFEVFSFSTDANKQQWMNAIKADHLTWLNVSDLMGFYSKATASYQIRMIPQNFLIDPNGIIIAKNLGADDLEKKLKDIFKE